MKTNSTHAWKFFRVGGVDQVTFRNGADIANLDQLDQKLWMTLAMPTRGVEFDARTADLIDLDKDGRIRPPEVIAAVKWAETAFKDLGDLLKSSDSVALAAIKDPNILAGANRILAILKKPAATAITLADVADATKNLVETRFNGDGVIIPETAEDPAIKKIIEDIIAVLGAVVDRSGKPGLNQAKLDQFFTELQTLADWAVKGEADAALTPLGLEGTVAAAAAVRAVKAKVDDYFARCRLAAYDPRALVALNREEKEYLAVTVKDLSLTAQELAGFPLATIAAGKALPLSGPVNPAWAGALTALNSAAITPLLGAGLTNLTESDWTTLTAKLGAFECWSAGKPATAVEKLGLPRLRELVKSGAKDKIAALIKQDAALEGEFSQFASVEKLVRFQKDLYELLTNFVNFADFYGRTWAVFQSGTLYLDNRSCNLCIEVGDGGKHGALAHLSGAYLAYCDLSRPGGAKRQVVAVFTDGDSDNLIVGRNGVFYDRKGQDWDATITKIVANSISIREAFWSPYKKLVRMIEDQIAKRAAAADAAAHQQLATTAQTAVNADKAKPEPPKKIDTGTLAAIGLVLTTLLGALGTIFAAILKLPTWQIPLVMVGIVLGISLPSMFLAYMKLRKRNLGPILDANGWAINNVAKMNIPFGESLTDLPELPAGSERSLEDPFADKKRPWGLYIFVAAVLGLFVLIFAWFNGSLDDNLPKGLKHDTYFEHETWFGKKPIDPVASLIPAENAAGAAPRAATNAPPTK